MKTEKPNTLEEILTAGLAAQIGLAIKQGHNPYEALETVPGYAHSAVVEILDRKGLLK